MEQVADRYRRILYLVISAAGAAAHIQDFIVAASSANWEIFPFATPQALPYIDTTAIERLTQHAVQHTYEFLEKLDTLPEAEAIVAAPITFENINQWVQGTGDSLAVLVLCEGSSQGIPTIVAPSIRPGLMQHPALVTSIAQLRQWNIRSSTNQKKRILSLWFHGKPSLKNCASCNNNTIRIQYLVQTFSPKRSLPRMRQKSINSSAGYLARLARTGTVRARRFGRDWIIDETALRSYLAQPRKPVPGPA